MRRKIIGMLICTLLIVTAISAVGQIKDISIIKDDNEINPTNNGDKWMKTYDFTFYDFGKSVQQTSDGGFIVIGISRQFVGMDDDIILLKTDSMGNKQWGKTFGGNNDDYAFIVKQISDGGYIIVGRTASFSTGDSDIWLIKIDSNGNKLWDKLFGSSEYNEGGTDIIKISDDGYIILAYKQLVDDQDYQNSIWVIKTDINGNLEWDKTFSKENPRKGLSGRIIQELDDGGYIIAGDIRTIISRHCDLYLLKINSEGILQWEKSFDKNDYEYCYSFDKTSDGDFIILGNTYEEDPLWYDVWLLKTNSEGELLWDKTYGGNGYDWGNSVQMTTDGGFIIGGYMYTSPGTDGFLLKTNDAGEQEWFKRYRKTQYNIIESARQTTDGGYIFTGDTDEVPLPLRTDVWLVKTDENGDAPPGKSRDLWRSRLFELFPNLFPILRQLLRL